MLGYIKLVGDNYPQIFEGTGSCNCFIIITQPYERTAPVKWETVVYKNHETMKKDIF